MSSTDKPLSNDSDSTGSSAPVIHKISERAPEFPCWIWFPDHAIERGPIVLGGWNFYTIDPRPAVLERGGVWFGTYWSHSDTWPTITPEAVGKVKEHPAPAPSREPSDTEKILELRTALKELIPFAEMALDIEPVGGPGENCGVNRGNAALEYARAVLESAAMKGTTP